MKAYRISFSLTFIILIYSIGHSQCPEGDIQFTTQHQINDFVENFPHCNRVKGNVTIGKDFDSTDINDLTPLKNIRGLGGYLKIFNNSELRSVEGLENLTSIGGSLIIYNNDYLKDVNGLQNLTNIGGSLWVIKNELISSIVGLQNLRSMNGSLDISDNPSLVSFEGIHNIDPTSIKPTLDFQLIKMIDIRFKDHHTIVADQWSKMIYEPTDKELVERFQSMVTKPYKDRAVETGLLYQIFESITDSIQVYGVLDHFTDIARDAKVLELIWEVELLKSFWHLKNGSASLTQRIESIQTLANNAGRKGMLQIQACALKYLSYKPLMKLQAYEKIFKNYHALEKVLDQLPPEDFPDMAQCYMLIGKAHYFFNDYREAIRCFGKAVALPKIPYNTTFIMHSLNSIGFCYRNLNFPDSSDFYFKQILQDTTSYPIKVWEGIASGNLGHNHYRRGEYEQAIPLLQRDIHNGVAMDDLGLAAGGLIPLADIRIKQNELENAKFYIDRARKYIRRSGQTERLRYLFPIITKWYSSMGYGDRVEDYIDSTQQIIRNYNERINGLKLLRVQQELNAKIRINHLEQQKLILQRNLVLFIIVLLFTLVSVFLWYRNKNIKRKQELHDLQLRNARSSLENARSRLANQALKIRENDKIIHHLKKEFKGQNDSTTLRELKNATILTEEDWTQFKENFQKAYPGILNKLETSYSALTPAEIRCLCLMKLGLTNREMATAQGVAPRSIYVTNYRIRKKLNFQNQEMLDELIKGLK